MKKLLWSSFLVLAVPFLTSAAFERDLYVGMRNNNDVRALQQFLTDQNLYSGPLTGNFFTLTRWGVIRFQGREHITPASGYFGPRTRARASELMAGTKTKTDSNKTPSSAEDLLQAIASLRAQLKVLQEEPTGSTTTVVPPPPPVTVVLPEFISKPNVAESGFLSAPYKYGPGFAYYAKISWRGDVGTAKEEYECSPSAKVEYSPLGSLTLYPEAGKISTCKITIANSSGSKSDTVTITTPSWFSVDGHATSSFPAIVTVANKIGEIQLYNGSTTDILFSHLELILGENINSTFNRNRKVTFLLKDGPEAISTDISKTDFTFSSVTPSAGNQNRASLRFPASITIKAGEKRTLGVWIEQLQYVRGGTMELISTAVVVAAVDSVQGSFHLVLTKEPDL